MRLKSTRMFSSTLYSRFAPPVVRNEKSTIEQSATMSTPLLERFIGQDFSVFLVLITFSLSLQKCLQIAVFFLYLYLVEQCAPSKYPSHLSIFNLLYHPPSLPPVLPLLLQAFILKGMKFVLSSNKGYPGE